MEGGGLGVVPMFFPSASNAMMSRSSNYNLLCRTTCCVLVILASNGVIVLYGNTAVILSMILCIQLSSDKKALCKHTINTLLLCPYSISYTCSCIKQY